MNGQNRSDIEADAPVDIVIKKAQITDTLTCGRVQGFMLRLFQPI